MEDEECMDFSPFYGIKFDETIIEKFISNLLKLTAKLQDNSYTSNLTAISKIKINEISKIFKDYYDFCDSQIPSPTRLGLFIANERKKIKQKIKSEKDDYHYYGEMKDNKKHGNGLYTHSTMTELLGEFQEDKFIKGIGLFNQRNSLYVGTFNNSYKDNNNNNNAVDNFKGVFYPNLNKNEVYIGSIKNSEFKGVRFAKNDNKFYSTVVVTSKYKINYNTQHSDTLHFVLLNNPSERNKYYSIKEGVYFTCKTEDTDIIYYHICPTTSALISYEVPSTFDLSETEVTIIYPENNVYIGQADTKNNLQLNGKGVYYIRIKFHADVLYRIEGLWKKGMLVEGKVYDGKDDRLLFEGKFKNNEPYEGVYYYNDKEKYEGMINQFKRNGKGKYYYENGDMFEGGFDNDKPQGKVVFTDSEGVSKELVIQDNTIIK